MARYLNKPTSSKYIDKNVIEKNKVNIFKGLTSLLDVSSEKTTSIGTNEKINKIEAPNKDITQYVDIDSLPILILGNNIIDKLTNINVITEIIIVGIIITIRYYEPIFIIVLVLYKLFYIF